MEGDINETEKEDRAELQAQDLEFENAVEVDEMETLAEGGNDNRTVNVSVSHVGLTESLRSLKGMKTAVRTQAQGTSRGPRSETKKSLKDVTNKSEFRPTIAKTSRPITKVNGAQQKENKSLEVGRKSVEGRPKERSPSNDPTRSFEWWDTGTSGQAGW